MSFDDAYQHYYPKVLGFFLRRGVEQEEARDLTHSVFLRVWSHWKTVDGGTLESMAPWIFTITRNAYLNKVRDDNARRHRPPGGLVAFLGAEEPIDLEVSGVPASEANPEEVLEKKESRELLESAIDALPPRMRQCLRLYLAGYRYADVAALMETSIETVKSQIFQARQRLVAALSEPSRAPGSSS